MENYIEIKLPAISKNESLARNAIALFCVELKPTVDELDDVKTAIGEGKDRVRHAPLRKDGPLLWRKCGIP